MKSILLLFVAMLVCSCTATRDAVVRPLSEVITETAKEAKKAGATKLTLNLSTANGYEAGATVPISVVAATGKLTRADTKQVVVEIPDLQAWPPKPQSASAPKLFLFNQDSSTLIPMQTPSL